MRRFSLTCVLAGATLFLLGVGLRVYASATDAAIERRLSAARRASAASLAGPPPFTFRPTRKMPDSVRLPTYGLWNRLEPVNVEMSGTNGQFTWQAKDAGWHVTSGLPGWGSNVVVAGHSPSSDRAVWSRSVFRQLAYLNLGDEIDLTAGNVLYRYAVTAVFSIPAAEAGTDNAAAWLATDLGERLTLITCWPPNTAAYRVIVVAYPVRSEDLR